MTDVLTVALLEGGVIAYLAVRLMQEKHNLAVLRQSIREYVCSMRAKPVGE